MKNSRANSIVPQDIADEGAQRASSVAEQRWNRQRDKVVANAQRKKQRGRQKKLVAILDAVLPSEAKKKATSNGAGGRALGTRGRSLHNVLEDTVDFFHTWKRKQRETDADASAGSLSPSCKIPHADAPGAPDAPSAERAGAHTNAVDNKTIRNGIMSSQTLAAIELSLPDWTMISLNPGARSLLGSVDDEWSNFEGQCMLNSFIHPEDYAIVQRMWDEAKTQSTCADFEQQKHEGASEAKSEKVRMLRVYRTTTNFGLPSEENAESVEVASSEEKNGEYPVQAQNRIAANYFYVDAVMLSMPLQRCGEGGRCKGRAGRERWRALMLCMACADKDAESLTPTHFFGPWPRMSVVGTLARQDLVAFCLHLLVCISRHECACLARHPLLLSALSRCITPPPPLPFLRHVIEAFVLYLPPL